MTGVRSSHKRGWQPDQDETTAKKVRPTHPPPDFKDNPSGDDAASVPDTEALKRIAEAGGFDLSSLRGVQTTC